MNVTMPEDRSEFYLFPDKLYFRKIKVKFKICWKLLNWKCIPKTTVLMPDNQGRILFRNNVTDFILAKI